MIAEGIFVVDVIGRVLAMSVSGAWDGAAAAAAVAVFMKCRRTREVGNAFMTKFGLKTAARPQAARASPRVNPMRGVGDVVFYDVRGRRREQSAGHERRAHHDPLA
jgi:hypothetical protein